MSELRHRRDEVTVEVPEQISPHSLDYMPPDYQDFPSATKHKRQNWWHCRRKRDWFSEQDGIFDAETVNRTWRGMKKLCAGFAIVAVFYVCLLVAFSSDKDEASTTNAMQEARFSHTPVRLAWHSYDGDTRRLHASKLLGCSDILDAVVLYNEQPWPLEHVFERVEEIHRGATSSAPLRCSCGPMFGFARRYMTIEHSPENFTHALNPTLECDTHNLSAVHESQQRLFPQQEATRRIARSNLCTLSYSTVRTECSVKQSIALHNEHAWCAQACNDLLDGISVYDKKQYQ